MLVVQMARMAELLANTIVLQNVKTNQVKALLTHSLDIDLELSLLMIEDRNLG